MYLVENKIQKVIEGIPSWVWRIIVIDDASPDQSAEKVLALNNDRVILLRHHTNQGVGGAVLTGYAKAYEIGASIMVKMDGDDQMSPDYLLDLIQPIADGRADYVKGNRFYHVYEIKKMPPIRRVGNIGLSFLLKLASGYWNIFDPTNGYCAMSADIYPHLKRENIAHGYFFESSMLLELSMLRAVVKDVPIPARYEDENSSLSIIRSLVEFPFPLLKAFLHRIWLQYFVLDFSLVSLFLIFGTIQVLFGLSWGIYSWGKSILSGISATTGTVMLAVMPFILGFQLLIQALVYDVQNYPREVISHRDHYKQLS